MSAARIAIGILLSIIGIICFIVFMWKGIYRGGYGDIVACVISLFSAFGGGLLLSSGTWKGGLIIASFGLLGTSVAGLLAWVAASSIENAGVEYMGEFFMFLIFTTLAALALAVMVLGLGMSFGTLMIPRMSKGHSGTTPQPPTELGEQ